MSIRYYDAAGKQVPRHHAVRAVQTITQHATHMGKRYISHVNRVGWLLSDPKRKVSFKNAKERDALLVGERMNLDLPG